MANLMNKFQTAAKKAGQQATAFSGQLAQSAASTSQQVTSSFTLEKECARAAATLRAFCADPSNPDSALNSIPKRVLQGARGLAIFTVVKAGMIWSGKLGSGLVIARLPDGSWSAPSCLGTTGVGFGFQVGADVSDFVIVLNSDDAVRAFATSGNMTIGGNLSAAVGPIGTGGSVDRRVAPKKPSRGSHLPQRPHQRRTPLHLLQIEGPLRRRFPRRHRSRRAERRECCFLRRQDTVHGPAVRQGAATGDCI
jgi:hypothetical protein